MKHQPEKAANYRAALLMAMLTVALVATLAARPY
jgi:hypothetical protein